METSASLQVLCHCGPCVVGVLRVHQERGDWERRSAWTWRCTVRLREGVAELFGADTAPFWAARLAIRELLKRHGAQAIEYEIKGRVVRRIL